MRQDDWTAKHVILALQHKNLSLTELMRQHKINKSNLHLLEAVISQALDIPLTQLWPSRYKQNDWDL